MFHEFARGFAHGWHSWVYLVGVCVGVSSAGTLFLSPVWIFSLVVDAVRRRKRST